MCETTSAFTVTHHLLTDSPRATSSPASSIHGKCPIQVYKFLIFIPYFYCTFSMFRYTNNVHCGTTAHSIQHQYVVQVGSTGAIGCTMVDVCGCKCTLMVAWQNPPRTHFSECILSLSNPWLYYARIDN